MRQIVIDELSPMERDNIDSYLKRSLKQASMAGLYWIEIPPDLLNEKQQGHKDCAPYTLGVEIDRQSVRFELLVRSNTNLHCECIGYASSAQRQFVLDFIDTMLAEEQIRA